MEKKNFYTRVFWVANCRYGSYEKIQNFSSVSVKLCLLGQKKNTGTWV